MQISKTDRLRAVFALLAIAGCLVSWLVLSGLQVALGTGLSLWLCAACYVDAQRYLLLDFFTLPLILAGLVLSYLGSGPPVLFAAIGAALGYSVFWVLSEIYLKLRGRHGLGLGDAKLLAAAGAWCGILALPIIVLIASISALMFVAYLAITGRKISTSLKLPFGPFLGLGFFVAWLGRQALLFPVFD